MSATIIGIYIEERQDEAKMVQNILTKYGCNIKTRLGLHEAGNSCSPHGIVLLQLCGDSAECEKLVTELTAVEGVDVKSMELGN